MSRGPLPILDPMRSQRRNSAPIAPGVAHRPGLPYTSRSRAPEPASPVERDKDVMTTLETGPIEICRIPVSTRFV